METHEPTESPFLQRIETKSGLREKYDEACESAWFLKHCDGKAARDLSAWSVFYGFGGLCIAGIFIAVIGVVVIESTEKLFPQYGPGSFWQSILSTYSLVFPALAVTSLISGAAALMPIPLTLRMALAIGLIIPGFFTFLVLMTILVGGSLNGGFWPALLTLFLLMGLSTVVTAVFFEMFTRARIVRFDADKLATAPKMAIQRLLELTGIVAALIAILRMVTPVPVIGQIIILVVASICSVVATVVLVICLSNRASTMSSKMKGFAFAYLIALIAVAIPYIVAHWRSEQELVRQFGWLLASALLLSGLLAVTCFLLLSWLRGCGWRSQPNPRSET